MPWHCAGPISKHAVALCGAATPTVTDVSVTPGAPNAGDVVTLAVTAADADNTTDCGLGQVLEVTSSFGARPAGSTATLSTEIGTSPAFVADLPGDYIVRTVVDDGTGRSDYMDTVVSVGGCGAHHPTLTRDAVSRWSGSTEESLAGPGPCGEGTYAP